MFSCYLEHSCIWESGGTVALCVTISIPCFLVGLLQCSFLYLFYKGNLMSADSHLLGKVEGMEIGLSLGLQSDKGGLKLSLSECGCHVEDITIELEGGASWFYQGYVITSYGNYLLIDDRTTSSYCKTGGF